MVDNLRPSSVENIVVNGGSISRKRIRVETRVVPEHVMEACRKPKKEEDNVASVKVEKVDQEVYKEDL